MAENDSLGGSVDEVVDPFADIDDVADDVNDDATDETTEFEEAVEDEVDDTSDETETETQEEDVEEDEDTKKANLYQSLKKSAPEVLKAHPELKDILVRENKYSEIFDTPEQAASVALRAQGLIDLESKILQGDSEVLLGSLLRVNKDQFLDFAHNFLPSLAKVDSNAFSDILRGPIKRVFRSAMAAGNNSKNDNLKNAALVLNEYFFDGEDITKDSPSHVKKEDSPEVKAAREGQTAVEKRLYENFKADVAEVYGTKLKKDILASFATLNESEFTKRALVKETEQALDQLLSNDKRHQANMSALWRQAQAAGFTREFKSKIYLAGLSKAKALLPLARKTALGSAKSNVNKGKQLTPKPAVKKKYVGDGSDAGSSSSRKIDWSKTSERDILSGKEPVYKK